MIMNNPVLSLCLPTNGVSEWIFPVLESVYSQNVDLSLFEVVVTNNGDNADFEKRIKEYASQKENLIYKKTKAFLFENQIEALRLASGEYLKFLNHRAIMENGSLEWMINLVNKYKKEKPVMYLSNGALNKKQVFETDSFDLFVRELREFASWTTGVGVWKSDFEKIPKDKVYNKISPHSDVLFAERKKSKYIIDDKIWNHEIDTNHKNKGTYDLFKAFGIEELSITLGLYLDGDISIDTLKSIKKNYEKLIIKFYRDFVILKRPCSYNLSSFNKSVSIFFNPAVIRIKAYFSFVPVVLKKICRINKIINN